MEERNFEIKLEQIGEPDLDREKALSRTFDDPDLDFLFAEPSGNS